MFQSPVKIVLVVVLVLLPGLYLPKVDDESDDKYYIRRVSANSIE
jgi:hypothetical protein